MNRRRVLTCVSAGLVGGLSGCLSGGVPARDDESEAPSSPTQAADTPIYDCDAATRPAPPEPDADPPGDAERYMYPIRPDSLSDDAIHTYVERYERAYRLNKLHSQYEVNLTRASVSIDETTSYNAPAGAAIAQIKHTYDAGIEGDDGPIEIDSPTLYASYYVDDEAVLRAVDTELQEDVSRLVADPIEDGQPVECF